MERAVIAPFTPIPASLVAEAKRTDITHLLPGLKRCSSISGGEYHGPCPSCGGKDRFVTWPQHPDGPRAFCRQCHPDTMDTIALVQWLGLARDFREAVALLMGGAIPSATPQLPIQAPPRPYKPPRPGQQVIAVYDYWIWPPGLPDGPPLVWVHAYRKERREPGEGGRSKTFYLCHLAPGAPMPDYDPDILRPLITPSHWRAGRGNTAPVPYNLRAAWLAPPGFPILWVDGEKDVETARAAGLIAVCGPNGGKNWQEEWGPVFSDHPAIAIPDQEPGGWEAAQRAARLIHPYASGVRIVPLPGKDLTAWLEAGCPLNGDG